MFISIFFSRANFIFWIMAISGGFLVSTGVIFKIFSLEFVKQKFRKKDVEELVKKEVEKSKKTEETKQTSNKPKDTKKDKTSKKSN